MSELLCPACGRRYSKSMCSVRCGTERLSPYWFRDYETEGLRWLRRQPFGLVILVSLYAPDSRSDAPLCEALQERTLLLAMHAWWMDALLSGE